MSTLPVGNNGASVRPKMLASPRQTFTDGPAYEHKGEIQAFESVVAKYLGHVEKLTKEGHSWGEKDGPLSQEYRAFRAAADPLVETLIHAGVEPWDVKEKSARRQFEKVGLELGLIKKTYDDPRRDAPLTEKQMGALGFVMGKAGFDEAKLGQFSQEAFGQAMTPGEITGNILDWMQDNPLALRKTGKSITPAQQERVLQPLLEEYGMTLDDLQKALRGPKGVGFDAKAMTMLELDRARMEFPRKDKGASAELGDPMA